MTNPVLWGPATWQALFACAWALKPADSQLFHHMLTTLLPLLIPCDKCRLHFADKKQKVTRRAKGPPDTPERAFRWVWVLKDEVNRSLRVPSITIDDLTQRFILHGPIVDDVALGDTLVLFAIDANLNGNDATFAEFANALATLLPLPSDSQILRVLCEPNEGRSILAWSLRAAKAARIERGLPMRPLSHYRIIADN